MDDELEPLDRTCVRSCHKCHDLAVWYYMPSSGEGDGNSVADNYCCDDHVSRGCSCNSYGDVIEASDERGLFLPCCEWDYCPDGHR